jgi:hypothetical protein
MQASDAGTAITRLQELVNAGPGANPDALNEVRAILARLASHEATSYQAEKLAAVMGSFNTWLSVGPLEGSGSDPESLRMHLLHDIEKLRKALARWAEGQD